MDPRQRFTDRAEHYARHRPGYAPGVVDVLRDGVGLVPDWIVADVGAGTGRSSEPFLTHGCSVVAVEPNAAMRRAAEAAAGDHPRFRSVDGSAEATGLEDRSVDLVVAAQAFHWFDRTAARAELARILRPPRWVAILWNVRAAGASAFMAEHEALLRELRPPPEPWLHLDAFFGGPIGRASLPHEQSLDWEGLSGLLLSASYAPRPTDAGAAQVLGVLRAAFDRHQAGGRVIMSYRTEMYYGRLEG